MTKLDIFLQICGFVIAVVGLTLIVINIMSNGSPTLTAGMACVLVSQALLFWSQYRQHKQNKK